ncbi:MAG: hypothetical protein WAM14_12115 [Candidatus Nitrosopolaris sp.]
MATLVTGGGSSKLSDIFCTKVNRTYSFTHMYRSFLSINLQIANEAVTNYMNPLDDIECISADVDRRHRAAAIRYKE